MAKRLRRTPFKNLHPHAPHTFAGVVRWKLGLSPEKSTRIARAKPAQVDIGQGGSPAASAPPPVEALRATWIGHSTFLIQHRGLNILTDPIFGDCQPVPVGRMRRSCAPGIRFEDLPRIDHVLISHSHYDHLDFPTVRALSRGVHFWLPEGLSGWFRKRRIAPCHELAWGQSAQLSDDVKIHCVPAQHGSARTLFDRNRSHWCGWVLESEDRKAYYAGDTGYSPIFEEIGQRFGGFDLAMIPIGAYTPRWLMQPVHLNPADAVKVHQDVRSKLSIACHWGTFRLADEPIEEPPLLLAQEMAKAQVEEDSFLAVRPGDSVEV